MPLHGGFQNKKVTILRRWNTKTADPRKSLKFWAEKNLERFHLNSFLLVDSVFSSNTSASLIAILAKPLGYTLLVYQTVGAPTLKGLWFTSLPRRQALLRPECSNLFQKVSPSHVPAGILEGFV